MDVMYFYGLNGFIFNEQIIGLFESQNHRMVGVGRDL